MSIILFIAGVILWFAVVLFYLQACQWIMTKGSPISQLIVSIAIVAFCLFMAKVNIEQSIFLAIMLCLSSVYYLWTAIKAFNKLVPTKEKTNEQV